MSDLRHIVPCFKCGSAIEVPCDPEAELVAMTGERDALQQECERLRDELKHYAEQIKAIPELKQRASDYWKLFEDEAIEKNALRARVVELEKVCEINGFTVPNPFAARAEAGKG